MSPTSPKRPNGRSSDSSDDVIDSEVGSVRQPDADAGDLSTGAADATPSVPAGAATRRPNPAASAASRARRIGGATGTRQTPAAEPTASKSTPTKSTGAKSTGGKSTGAKSTGDKSTVSNATATKSTGAKSTGDKSTVSNATATKSTGGKSTAGKSTAGAATSAASEPGVSMRKRRPRTTSARRLKAAADGSAAAATEVPGWLRWVPAIVLSLCAVAMIVLIAVSAHGVWYAKSSSTGARDKVLAAAKKCTAVANTYNYKTLAADEKRGLACTTGTWTVQYRSALEKIVKPTATQLKASQTVDINSAGIESVTGNGKQWTTVVYGQLTINQAGATPRIDQFAAIVRMDKVKSTYLVSKIDLVTSPNA